MDSRTEKALSVVLSHDREWRLQKLEERKHDFRKQIKTVFIPCGGSSNIPLN